MKRKWFWLLVLVTAVLTACGGGADVETVVETVEVTRVVTETVVEEGESVEVTRVVTEVEEVEVTREVGAEVIPAATEEPIGLPAAGSEAIAGAAPPAPAEGAKVDEVRGETAAAGSIDSADEVRSEGAAVADLDTGTVSARDDVEEEPALVGMPLDQNSRLTAGEVDDNAQWDDYLLYLRNYTGAAVIKTDVSERHQIWVRDEQERPIVGAQVEIEADGAVVATLRSHSDGRVYFFPRAYNVQSSTYTVRVLYNELTESFAIPADTLQREWFVNLAGGQANPTAQLDVLFLLDSTGSMSDEINQLKNNIGAISAQIDALPSQPDVRFGLVVYRDRGDAYVTQTYDFTPEVSDFAEILAAVRADGGGDYPEDLNEGLFEAIHDVEWRVGNSVSLIFLVADAPPHLDYEQQNHYAAEMKIAAERGIKVYPIASSGLDEQGEYVFRQLGQFTGGRFIFLTYGESGPGSSGTETNFEVSDYTVSSLDQLVVRIVEEELSHLVGQ